MLITLIAVVIVAIVSILFLFIFACGCVHAVVKGGMKSNMTPVMTRAKNMFIKTQMINVQVFKADHPRDFWIANFIYNLSNKLFALGKSNTMKGFPLVDNRDVIYSVLENMRMKTDLDELTDKTMEIIRSDQTQSDLSKYVTIINKPIEASQALYPDISKDSIIALLLRYGSMHTYTKDREDTMNLHISNTCLSIPPTLYAFYERTLPKCLECFGSPLNHTLKRYCSLFDDDKEFGAIGPFTPAIVKANKGNTFIANPPYDVITMNSVADIIHDQPNNNYCICLPCKDGGLFHMYEGRGPHAKNTNYKMNRAIDKMLRIKNLSGILVVPAAVMYYWAFFTNKKKTIYADSIFIFYLDKPDIIGYIKQIKDIIVQFNNRYVAPTRLYELEEDTIKELYPDTAPQIIESLKLEYV
jgi:hypothetical protein